MQQIAAILAHATYMKPPFIGRILRLGFFLRIPLLTLLLLTVLGPVSQYTAASSLLSNLFDAQNDAGNIWYDAFSISFAAFLLGFTAVTTFNLTLCYGGLRFGDDPDALTRSEDDLEDFRFARTRPGLTFTIGSLAACSLISTVILRTGWEHIWLTASAAVAAFFAACGMAFAAKVLQLALTNSNVTKRQPPYLLFPSDRIPWLKKRLDDLYCWPRQESQFPLAGTLRRLKSKLNSWTQTPFHTFRTAAQGYLIVSKNEDGESLHLRSGHLFALTLSLLAFLTYVIVGVKKAAIDAAPAAVPALAYVLLFLIVVCWALAAFTFFLDRYRFPLLLGMALLGLITATVPQSDHFFRVETPATVKKLQSVDRSRYLSPAEYLQARAKDLNHRRLILVATPGGGIQAAAWTAKVLKELDYKFKDVNGANGFRKSVALISSVSGGSLGSMIYAASFTGNVSPGCTAINAEASAIDEVAWGMTGPDVWRAILPLFRPPDLDRGWALEQKWGVVNGLSPEPHCSSCGVREKPTCVGVNTKASSAPLENDTYLSDWALRGTGVPALIFNSMLVERGQHVVFSTTRFPPKNDPRGIVNFYDLYPDVKQPFDIRVNTAARLSASFPFVAPASRPNLRSPQAGDFHYVDGGYYDNLGIDSLIGWLGSAYASDDSLESKTPEILILQIRHFNPDAAANGTSRGWGFQLFAPLKGLLSMWNNAPIHRDRNELDLLIQNVALSRKLKIQTVTIPYCGLNYNESSSTASTFASCVGSSDGKPLESSKVSEVSAMIAAMASKQEAVDCADQPLSWKLTARQKRCINDTWQVFARTDPNGSLAAIQQFLRH
jgi:hypothetical protein